MAMKIDERQWWPSLPLRYYWRMWRWRMHWQNRKANVLLPQWAAWLNSGQPLSANPWPL